MTLPWITPELPGVGGRIKSEPAHFVVSELPLYAPSGAGEHLYLTITREGRTTREVADQLARLFRVPPRDVGYAGMKDKHARTTQTFSLAVARVAAEEAAERVRGELGLEVELAARHGNKLRRGHLLGNRFRITIAGVGPDAATKARAVLAALESRGVANFFGPQRFGTRGRNAEHGRARLEALLARPARGFRAQLELSSWQSQLFNDWLEDRVARGEFAVLLAGDVAKRLDNGALFDVVDLEEERPRFERREITYTGPLLGADMRAAHGRPGELEAALLAASGVAPEALGRLRVAGSRRAGRIFLAEVALEERPGELVLSLRLPKGSFATVVLGEICKHEGAPEHEEESD